MPRAAYVTVKKERGIIILETPYSEKFVNALKTQSVAKILWNGQYWTVDISEKNLVVNLIKNYYRDVPAYLVEGAVATNIHTGEVC